MTNIADLRKDYKLASLNESDVAFLCLPDSAAREAVALVTNPGTCIIDASTAHRTNDGWAFGLPELAADQRERIRASKRIANPGCHASAFILLVRPLVDAGLLPADYPINGFSITGYSGGGKKMIEQYESPARIDAPRAYALGLAHKHLPEMCAYSGLTAASTAGCWTMAMPPKMASTANQSTITGPNSAPTLAVPRRWKRNRPTRIISVIGMM